MIGMAISNRRGMLGKWVLGREDTVTELNDVKVEAGETIDFVVVPKSTVAGGYFTWAPKISMSGKDWDANRDFEAASNQKRAGGKPLNEWERFAQTMLFSNELIYLN